MCPECAAHQECAEHTRLCFAWRQPTTTFVGGSVVTGVSSVCNAKEYDMSKYKELMDKLGEASLDIEAVLDDFPHGSNHHQQDRYNATRRTRDIDNEEEQLRTIENLLLRYQEQRVRLDEVGSDDEDGRDDAVAVGSREPTPYGLMSQTSTHYQFNTPAPQGLPLQHNVGGDGIGREDSALGFGLGIDLNEQDIFQTLTESLLNQSNPTDQPNTDLQSPSSSRRAHILPAITAGKRREPHCTSVTPQKEGHYAS